MSPSPHPSPSVHANPRVRALSHSLPLSLQLPLSPSPALTSIASLLARPPPPPSPNLLCRRLSISWKSASMWQKRNPCNPCNPRSRWLMSPRSCPPKKIGKYQPVLQCTPTPFNVFSIPSQYCSSWSALPASAHTHSLRVEQKVPARANRYTRARAHTHTHTHTRALFAPLTNPIALFFCIFFVVYCAPSVSCSR